MRVRGWTEPRGSQALVLQRDSEIAHYHVIYLALLHLITAGQRELEEYLGRTEQNGPLDTLNKKRDKEPAGPIQMIKILLSQKRIQFYTEMLQFYKRILICWELITWLSKILVYQHLFNMWKTIYSFMFIMHLIESEELKLWRKIWSKIRF